MSDLAALPEAERQSALERFRLLQPHLEEGRALSRVAREANIPYRTAQRWVSLYQRFGLAALARKERADRGTRRALSPQMQKVVEGLALQKPPLPIATLYRQAKYRTKIEGRLGSLLSQAVHTAASAPAATSPNHGEID